MTTKKANKKAENERRAADSLARLQARQKLVNELRGKGYVGTEKQILTKYNADLLEASRAARLKAETDEHNRQQQYIADAFNGPSKLALQKWLQNRHPTYERVKRFFDERPAQQHTKQIWKAA